MMDSLEYFLRERDPMCGILGYLDKQSATAPLGRVMVDMLQALSCRGPDSVGLALYGSPQTDWTIRIPLETIPNRQDFIGNVPSTAHGEDGAYLTMQVPMQPDTVAFERLIHTYCPTAEIVSLGQRLQIIKEVGTPRQLEAKYQISRFVGSHGIGHTRLSTESKVDLSHSQPFWAHGVPDLATVHNGHVTNYHKLRRQYEQRGYRFYTDNDSEVIGVYLRDRMARGLSFEDALRSSLDDFDGAFCYLAATQNQLAFVRDRFGFKPLIVAETDRFVAIATEEIALRKALGRDFSASEPPPGLYRIWNVS